MNERTRMELKIQEAYDNYCAEVSAGLREILDSAESGDCTMEDIALLASNLLRKVG